jgi:hypothetical protein
MRNQIFTRLIRLALFMTIAIAPVSAQQFNRSVMAKVPFKFVVGDRVLPAGEYSIKQLSPVVLMIRSSDGRTVTTVQTRACESVEPQSEASLVFNKYADQYFLSRVWVGGENQGRELKMSGGEGQLAKAGVKRETVTIARRQ